VKVYFARWLHPLEKEVWWKLLFFTHNCIVLSLCEKVLNQFTVISLTNEHISLIHLLTFLQINIVKRWIGKDWKFIAEPLIGPFIKPLMLGTMTHKFTLKPTIDRSVVALNIMVKSRVEFVWVEHLNGPLLPSSTDRLALPEIDLNVNHPVREGLQFGIVVCGTIEDKVSRLKVTLRQSLIGQ